VQPKDPPGCPLAAPCTILTMSLLICDAMAFKSSICRYFIGRKTTGMNNNLTVLRFYYLQDLSTGKEKTWS
jgi:hypothetical protein